MENYNQKALFEELKQYQENEIYNDYFLPNYKNSHNIKMIQWLLENGLISFQRIDASILTYLWENDSWIKNFILNNIDQFILDNDYNKLSALITTSMKCKEDFLQLCKCMLKNETITKRILCMDVLLDLGFPISEQLIIEPLCKKTEGNQQLEPEMEKNSVYEILEYRLDDPDIQEFLLTHYEKLFASSIQEKMQILSSVIDISPDIDSDLIKKYQVVLSYYRQIPSENQKWVDEILSKIIEVGKEDQLLEQMKERLKKDNLVLKDSGSYSVVLGTTEWVLKISKERITWNCPRESFLFNSSEFQQIIDRNGIPIAGIDWQPYLPIIDRQISKQLIYKYLIELRNQNLTLTDSTALAYNNSNFRYLKDVEHLEKQGVSLPEWFKKDPIVLIDIDAIYTRGENIEVDQKMDEAISNFKK